MSDHRQHPERSEGRATIDRVLDAFVQRDLAAAAACFADDGVYTERGRPQVDGRAAIAAHFAGFARGGRTWSFAVDDVAYGRHAVFVVYRFAAEGDGGQARERAGIALVRMNERGEITLWREYDG